MASTSSLAAKREITIIGGGLAGLTAAIASAEGGARVRLLEAHDELGGRARSATNAYKTNLGPHVLYKNGAFWRWMAARNILPRSTGVPFAGARLRWQGEIRRTPPLETIRPALRLRRRPAPCEAAFRTWATEQTNERTATLLSAIAGVYTFHHDPGELSAAFVWPRTVRTLLSPPVARYAIGGWSGLVTVLERRARDLGVAIHTGERVDVLPEPPVIIATELAQARELLDDRSLVWVGGRVLCMDFGLRHRRGDPFIVSDGDEAGWIERFTAADPSLAPSGEELVQAHMPMRPRESADTAAARLESLLDASLTDWRQRETWRRRQVMDARSGALDPPGTSWRDRPAIDRADGYFLVGDMVAAPGLLSEVSWASALEASRRALEMLATEPLIARPRVRAAAAPFA